MKRVKNVIEKRDSGEKCSRGTCQFPNTCNWNQKCMQKELELSIAAKKTPSSLTKDKRQENPIRKKT